VFIDTTHFVFLLPGTLASGAIYTYAGANPVYGLGYCFLASMCFAALATLVTVLIQDDSGGLKCGACLTLVRPPAPPLPVSSSSTSTSQLEGAPQKPPADPRADTTPAVSCSISQRDETNPGDHESGGSKPASPPKV
jgi:hypothetical protein